MTETTQAAVTVTLLFSILFGGVLIALSITENRAVEKMAIKNRCEYNTQADVWEYCKGPIIKEIE